MNGPLLHAPALRATPPHVQSLSDKIIYQYIRSYVLHTHDNDALNMTTIGWRYSDGCRYRCSACARSKLQPTTPRYAFPLNHRNSMKNTNWLAPIICAEVKCVALECRRRGNLEGSGHHPERCFSRKWHRSHHISETRTYTQSLSFQRFSLPLHGKLFWFRRKSARMHCSFCCSCRLLFHFYACLCCHFALSRVCEAHVVEGFRSIPPQLEL